ncbi:MAG TPA: hypothetical protein VFO18_14120 [Methylomirabilota bacterium]|nr:hypothetical protein [Methylomirabilota bacterium]
MLAPLRYAAALLLAGMLLAACADDMVRFRSFRDPQIQPLPGAQAVTVFRFDDVRGEESEGHNPLLVGATYNGVGMKTGKVLTPTPWPESLVEQLAEGFTQRGARTVAVKDRVYAPGSAVSTPLVLAGEIHNFSTEARWRDEWAHVSGIMRLYDQRGALQVEKPVNIRVRSVEAQSLEAILNSAVNQFVRAVVTDPDVTRRLAGSR